MSDIDPTVRRVAEQSKIVFDVLECDPDLADTAAFCEQYGFTLDESANTILVMSRKVAPTLYAACVVLATTRLDVNKKVCELLGTKRASFADGETTQRITGMLIGGVTAIGITDMPIYIDARVLKQPKVVMGGGNRSSKLVLNPNELTKLPNVHIVSDLANPKPE